MDIALAGRLIVGALLVAAGVAKVRVGPSAVRRAVLGFDILPPPVAQLVVYGLPGLEFATGLVLVAGVASGLAAGFAALLLLAFNGAVVRNLARRHPNDCGCFGSGGRIRWALAYRNLILVALLLPTLVAELPSLRFAAFDGQVTGSAGALWVVWSLAIAATFLLHRSRDRQDSHSAQVGGRA